jgi:hypothetical protein
MADEQCGQEREQISLKAGDEQLEHHDRDGGRDGIRRSSPPMTQRANAAGTNPMITASRMWPAVMLAAKHTASRA